MLSFFASILLFVSACTSNSPETNTEITELPVSAEVERRYDEVRAIHDEIMPRRADMIRLEREVLASDLDSSRVAFAKTRFERADDAMMSWMKSEESLTTLAQKMSTEEIKVYIDQREKQIRDVADSMTTSIEYAQQLLTQ